MKSDSFILQFYGGQNLTLFMQRSVSSRQLDLLIDARERSPILRAKSELFFTPIELDSERATKIKHEYYEAQEEDPKPTEMRLEPPPQERIERWLERSEAGEPEAWWVLLQEMTLEKTSQRYGRVPLDARKLPGWEEADALTRQRILAAADRFVRDGRVDPLKWLREPHSWRTSDTAAYVALFLIKNEAPAVYDALPRWVWERHVPTVLCAPFFQSDGDQQSQHDEIALRCHQQAKAAVLSYLPMQIDAEDHAGEQSSCDRKLGLCWDDDLKQTVYDKLVEAQAYWRDTTFGRIANSLLMHGHQPTRELLAGVVRAVADGTGADLARARVAAASIFAHSPDGAWGIIWPALLANSGFGRALLESIARSAHYNQVDVSSKLTAYQLSNLFVWLVEQWPYSPDQAEDQSVCRFRDEILHVLKSLGTPDCVKALQRVSDLLSELDWLKATVIEARKNTLRKTWRPCTPADILQIAAHPNNHLVRNAQELQNLLVSVIRRLETMLQGETPAAPDLWDQVDRTRGGEMFRPKDENHLSDWVKRNLASGLRGFGIVAAREVEIRRGEGTGEGESTDIHVTGLVPGLSDGSFEPVRVIIEVKGCWHRELKTAMHTQLVDRYLKDNQCQHGIYLVGWYVCPQWDSKDYRNTNTPQWSIDDARTELQQQAASLSIGGVSIHAVVLNAALR